MSGRRRFRCVVACALLCALSRACEGPAAEPAPDGGKPAPLSAEVRIARALERPIKLEFTETPLADVAAWFRGRLGVPVVLDRKALEEVKIGTDTQVTKHLEGIPARSALTILLRELDLTWTVRHEVLLITTPEEERARLQTRVYDVSALTGEARELEGFRIDPCADLINLVWHLVEPSSWKEVGGPGSMAALSTPKFRALVVSNTWQAQRQVGALLDTLHRINRNAAAARKAVSIRLPPFSPQEEAIRRALAKPVKMEFVETPLDDVIVFLRKELKVEIQMDKRALEDASIGNDMPITFRCKRLSARAALELILRERDLTWVIEHDVLLITTPEEAETYEEAWLYEVSDLVLPAGLPAGADPCGQADFDSVIDLITSTVRPESWPDGTGPGPVQPFVLPGANFVVFSQMADVHEEAGQLLTVLREIKRLGDPRKLDTVPISFRVPPATEAEKAIRKALGQPVRIEVIETPLEDVLGLFRNQMSVEIHVDRPALDDVGVGVDTPVTKNLKGISARSALRLLLSELDLTWQVRGEILLITTPEEAEYRMQTRLYPVLDLVLHRRADGTNEADFESLIDVITTSVVPTTWDTSGGYGSIAPFPMLGCLVASQNEELHERVEWLIGELRKVQRKRAGRPVKRDKPTQENALRKALRRPVETDFQKTPLQDVADFLKDLLAIEIQLERRALDDVGIGTDTPVTLAVKGISARAALNHVLRPLDLTWVIHNEVVLITTPEAAESTLLRTEVYDVTDLVPVAETKKEAEVPAAGGPAADYGLPAFLRPSGVFDPSSGPGAVSMFRGPNFNAVILTSTREARGEFEDLLEQLRKVSKEE